MRIIAGKFKGKQLRALAGMATRPTQDRVREALFSILADIVDDATVLELYAGTGAVGLEALSRGARTVHFVEQSHPCIKVLEANIESVGARPSCTVHPLPVERSWGRLKTLGLQFDLVFLDPPYEKGILVPALDGLASSSLLAAEATVVAQHEPRLTMPDQIKNLKLNDFRRYGDTALSFFIPQREGLS